MGAGLLAVKSGFILFIKNYQFPLQINTLERERERERERTKDMIVVRWKEKKTFPSNLEGLGKNETGR